MENTAVSNVGVGGIAVYEFFGRGRDRREGVDCEQGRLGGRGGKYGSMGRGG